MRITDAEWAELQASLVAWRESLDPQPAPEPEPAPQPEPTPEPGDVVLLGSKAGSQDFRTGFPEDRADLATLEAAIAATPPWSVFADELQTISPSQNGVRATSFVKLPVYGNMNGLYREIPSLNGQVYQLLNYDFGVIANYLKTYGAKAGPRGANLMTAYTTWHGHTRVRQDGTISTSPHVPMWVGIQMDGWVVYAMRDGSFQMAFQLPDVGATSDFTFSEAVREIFYVTDALKGCVYKVDRRDWSVSVFATGFVKPTSIREVGGVLYVADNGAGALYRLEPDGTKVKVLDMSRIFWIDGTSDGKVVAAAQTLGLYLVDPSGSHVVLKEPLATARSWLTVSVDRNGTFGPKDEFTLIAVGGVGNTDLWRWQDGELKYQPIPNGLGLCTVGNTKFCQDYVGHYVWIAEHHHDEGVLLVQGLANIFPSLIAVRPNYAAEDVYDHNLYGRGKTLLRYGTVDSLRGTQPSFTCQMSEDCWSLIGCTADMIAEKTFAEAAAFVQQGMFGSFPRPEIVGPDLHAVLYVLYRSSQRFLREGKVLMDGLKAFFEEVTGG